MNAIFNLGMKTKIILGFLFVLISTAVMVGLIISGISEVNEIQANMALSSDINHDLIQLKSDENLGRSIAFEMKYAKDITTQKNLMTKLDDITNSIDRTEILLTKKMENFEKLYLEFPAIQKDLRQYRKTRDLFILQNIAPEYEDSLKMILNEFDLAFAKITNDIQKLESIVDDQLLQFQKDAIDAMAQKKSQLTIIGGLIVFVAFFVILIIMSMFKKISFKLREGLSVLKHTSTDIQTTIAEISTGTNETATSIAETTTTVEEIRQTSMMANQKAKNLLTSSQKASEYAEQGLESSQQMIDAMSNIEAKMLIISNTINKLSEQNRSIGEITSTVSDIADQSNLLAVNAAIEAAKAGEHGRGFTVVAQEIRSLAEQSKKSTAQVKEILNEIQKSTEQAVDVMKQGAMSVNEGSKLVVEDRKVVELLTETVEEAMQASVQISASSQQQMAGMDQIVPAMENIKFASDQNASGMRNTQKAANNLNSLSENLRMILDKYKL